jgi:hypothetical protein
MIKINKTIKSMRSLCVLCLLCVLSVSCDDYLDVTPSDKQTAAQVYANKAGFYMVANGIYDALSSDALYGKQMTWEAVDIMSRSYNTANDQQAYKSLTSNSYTDAYTSPVFSSIWGKAYEVIMNANLLIDQIDQQQGLLTTQEANVLKGEMLGVRAFLHLDMLRLFGPSPLYGIDQKAIPYNESSDVFVHDLITIKEACAKIIEDLNAAEKLLENDPIIENGPMMSPAEGAESVQMRYRQYRMNYYAVKALKARAYCWVGDKENALAQATSIINDQKIQAMFPPVDPNKLLANSSNPDRVFSSEVFMGVYDKDRDKVYQDYFSSNASEYQRLQPYATYINGSMGLFGHLILGSLESYDYRYQSQWEQASGVGATGHSFIKFKSIDRPDPTDADSEYYYAKMIPLVTMQEMYHIACECAPTDMEKVEWYNKARVRRGCIDLVAMGLGPTLAQYWPAGYGPILLSNEVRREFWGTGQWIYFTKHVDIGMALGMSGPGAYYLTDCGAEQNYGTIDCQPPLPAEEMK